MPKKLTNRQRRFALAYAADPQDNGTKAALAAGCPKTSAHVIASRWLKNTDVQDHVEQFLGRVAQKYELSAEKVIRELCKLAFANMADYVEINREGAAFLSLSEMTRDQAAATHEITLENRDRGDTRNPNASRVLRVRLSDRVRSLELLGKFLKFVSKGSCLGGRARQGNRRRFTAALSTSCSHLEERRLGDQQRSEWWNFPVLRDN
jgi:phage terminase small subunit